MKTQKYHKLKKWSKVFFLLAPFLIVGITLAMFSTSTNTLNVFETTGYTFNINTNGGVYDYQKVTVKDNKTRLPNPQKEGYDFLGYSESVDGEIIYPKDSDIDPSRINNKIINARWKVITYNIIYNLNGGSITGQKSSYTVEETFTLPEPTKKGYTFTGWTGSNGNTPQKNVTIPRGTIGNLNYTANWKANNYTISYNLNGGSITGQKPSYTVEETFTLPEPTKKGYTFTGWTGSNGNTPQKNVTVPKGTIGNLNYTANWKANNYTISYNLNGGSITGQKPSYTVEETFTLPEPTKEGYTFTGWTGSNGSIPQKNVTVPKGTVNNLSYIANWNINKYKVDVNSIISEITYNAGKIGFYFNVYVNGKTTAANVLDFETSIDYGTPIRVVAVSKPGYNLSNNDVSKVVGTDGLVFNPTWDIITYNIVYNLNGGSITGQKSSYTVEETFTLPEPTKEGYTFTGWTGSNGNTPQKNVTVPKGTIGNLNYTANWKANNYTISYNLNGGSITGQKSSYTVEETFTLPEPTKKGYTFTGWTGSNGNTPQKNVTVPRGTIGNLNYIANWKANNYTISYNLNGGSITGQKPSYTVEEAFTLPTPAKEGYTFTGWTGSNGSIPQKSVTVPKGTINNLNYIANWSINYYSVDVNPKIHDTIYGSGLDSFGFTVYINGNLVANNVVDYYESLPYGTKVRVVVNPRAGYNIYSFTDYTFTITGDLNIEPWWYDDIPPTIVAFHVTNLGLNDPTNPGKGYNIRVYIEAYDEGTGIQKYENQIMPYGVGSGSTRKEGNDRIFTNVLYLNTASGRTFYAYAIDWAGNETAVSQIIRV